MVRLSSWIRTINSVIWLARDVKEPMHLSKREGHVVPGVVIYLYSCMANLKTANTTKQTARLSLLIVFLFPGQFHPWVGWVGEIKYGLITAARGAFTS